MKLRTSLCVIAIVASFSVQAKDYGVHSTTFNIKEESLLEVIQKRLRKLNETGVIEHHQQEVTKRVRHSVENPPAVKGLKHTQEERVAFYDPTMVMKEGVKDHQGHFVILPGTSVNPLSYVKWGQPLLFIDGDEEPQVELLHQWPTVKVVLTNGRPLTLEKDVRRPIYFDQGGTLAKKLGIQQVPCLVSQEGMALKIHEFRVDGKN